MGWRYLNDKFVNPAKRLMKQGKLKEAEELLLWGYREKKDGWIAYHLGEVNVSLKRPEEALKYYLLAEKALPKSDYKKLARDGQKKTQTLLEGGTIPPSWIYINNTYIYPSRSMIDPEKALELLKEGYQKYKDPWIAFNIGIHMRELGKIEEAKKNFEIAYNGLPLPHYKSLARQELVSLKETIIEEEKKVVDSSAITITEINGPNEISPDKTNFEVQLKIENATSKEQPVKIWFNTLWPDGRMGTRPTFYAKRGITITPIPIPTPSNDGKYILEIQLLNHKEILLENQIFQISIEVKTSGAKKLLKWGKFLGLMFGPRL